MRYFYSAAIGLYGLGIFAASFFSPKARLWIQGRKKIFRQIGDSVKNERVIWMHAASLGEFEQGRPVMEEIRRRYPQSKILLTFFSPSGYEIRKKSSGADYVFYLPLDTQHNAIRFISLIKPSMAIFIKYEFWYHYLNQLHKAHVPVYLISGIFRPSQIFFRRYGKWFRKMLFFFDHLFVQNQESASLLKAISVTNVTVAGDTRFDRVRQIAASTREIPLAVRFKSDCICVVAGSTWPADENFLIRYINSCDEPVKFIIAPHEIHEEHIRRIIQELKKPFVRFSEAIDTPITEKQILIIDNIGLLSSLYRYGDIAYIGGGFGKGIHNILEAATFGLPVLFGPNYSKFSEAVELIRLGGAVSVSGMDEIQSHLARWLSDKAERLSAGAVAKEYVHRKAGATSVIVNHLFSGQQQ
jgi:3-deoxy-D-manno-octulosonic-acid transferase